MSKNSYKSQINLLKGFILEREEKLLSEQTVKGLLRSILIPAFEDSQHSYHVFLKLRDVRDIDGVIKRLEFAQNIKTYSYNYNLSFKNVEKKDIGGEAEFVFVISDRYSSCIVWHYSLFGEKASPIYFKVNSRNILEVLKIVLDNTNIDLNSEIAKYGSERRANPVMNEVLNQICELAQNNYLENIALKAEKNQLSMADENLFSQKFIAQKSRFISHEIKNHLSIINLYSKILEKKAIKENYDKNSLKKAILNIQKASASISELLAELKNFSQNELEEANISDLILEVISLVSQKAQEKNIKIIYENEAKIVGLVNKFKTENVLINLFYNAIDASNENSKINIFSKIAPNNYVQILVKDEGCGIPKDK